MAKVSFIITDYTDENGPGIKPHVETADMGDPSAPLTPAMEFAVFLSYLWGRGELQQAWMQRMPEVRKHAVELASAMSSEKSTSE